MERKMELNSNIVVVGGGPAGFGAALSATQAGLKVLLIESSGNIGGEMLSGMPILGAYDSTGRQCSGGILNQLSSLCDNMDGNVRYLDLAEV